MCCDGDGTVPLSFHAISEKHGPTEGTARAVRPNEGRKHVCPGSRAEKPVRRFAESKGHPSG